MKFNFDDYKGEYVMHCKTGDEANDFCRVMHKSGLEWYTGDSYISENSWNRNKENTCYCFNEGLYCDKDWYVNEGYTILEWSDFMNKKFTKVDLKNGDVVLRCGGDVEIVIVETGTMLCKSGGHNELKTINEDLTEAYSSIFDIIAVRRPKKPSECNFNAFKYEQGELVYDRERDEPQAEEMTLEQVCKALGKNIKIV